MTGTKTILFPTDYSEPSQAALAIATSLARDWKARLIIAHVSETELYPVGESFDEDPTPSPAAMKEIEAIRPDDPQVPFEHRLLFPSPSSDTVHPAEEIIKFAQREEVNAIVLGTHGRTGLSRLLAGSVAESVLRQAPCALW